ncbi:MAG: hypothetical protein AB7O65_00670 [Candidatus Korobacteraceae bacterium]
MFAANRLGSAQNLGIYTAHTTSQLSGTSGNGGSVGGLRGRQNNFTIDGINNTDPITSVSSFEVIQDAVHEFTVLANHFDAEYGSAAGGQFSITSRTGSDAFHGGLWNYGSNRNLNAASSHEERQIQSGASRTKNRFDYFRTGGRIGGPILNRLFFFGAFERQNTNLQGTSRSIFAPTIDGVTALKGIAANASVVDLLNYFPTAPAADYFVPVTVPSGVFQIPVGRAIANSPSYLSQYQYVSNIDFVGQYQQLHLRHIQDWQRQPNNGSFPQPAFSADSAADQQRTIAAHTWVMDNRTTSDLRATYGRLMLAFPVSEIGARYPTTIIDELGAVIGPAGNLPQHRTSNFYDILYSVGRSGTRHYWKAGAEYRWNTTTSVFLSQARGQNQYRTLSRLVNDQIPDQPGGVLQGVGNDAFSGNAKNVAWFFSSSVHLSPHFTVDAGLRYDFFGLPKGATDNSLNAVSNCVSCVTPFGFNLVFRKPKDDTNNFAPRVGFAWDLTGSGKWLVRGGSGIGYDQLPYSFYITSGPPQRSALLNPNTACSGVFGSPPAWCPDFLLGRPGAGYLSGGGMQLNFSPPSTQQTARNLTSAMMPDHFSPQVFSWTVGVQRELRKKTRAELRYLGTRALRLPVQTQLNSITIFERGFTGLPTYLSLAEVPSIVPDSAPTRAAAVALQGQRFTAEGFRNVITAYPSLGSSRYHGGSLELLHRGDRFFVQLNYTLSRAEDNSTNDSATSIVNPRRAEDAFDLNREWGRSVFDVRHKVALLWTYDLPGVSIQNSVFRLGLSGWRWSGSYLWQGGQPITVQSGVDSNGNGDAVGDRAIYNPAGLPRTGTSTSRLCRDASNGTTRIDNSCPDSRTVGYVANNPNARYVQAQLGSRTNLGRNTERSVPLNVWNMALSKNIPLGERVSFDFQLAAYNVFNHRNYSLAPANIFGSTNAQSTSYANVSNRDFLNEKQFDAAGRILQLQLKVLF